MYLQDFRATIEGLGTTLPDPTHDMNGLSQFPYD